MSANNEAARFDGLKAGETKTINYRYTVTAADVKSGKIECSASLKLGGVEFDTDPVFGEWLTYTVYTGGAKDINPATGTGAPITAAAVILLGIAVLSRRRSK